ncbi:MAG: flagellar motor switch phosphatase FliY [Lachnospiraceae bacterium]|nr:flagellar motor switch phosphatase FliY [Lachnospiraceae bacterium]
MEGMLTQDEINALLSGMDLSGSSDDASPEKSQPQPDQSTDDVLSDIERDAVGEIANISMGSSATSLFSLVNQKVNITTPVVSIANWDHLLQSYEKPCVFIQIQYTEGLDGSNILVLKEQDVKIIADLMMGGDGTNTAGELGELHLSAISEAMNQMMGASATSLSQMFGNKIDISPPEAQLLDLTSVVSGSDISPFLGGTFVKVAFRMQIGDLVDSMIMQLYPIEFCKKLVDTFISQQMIDDASAPAPAPVSTEPKKTADHAAGMQSQTDMPQMDMQSQMGMQSQMDMQSQMGMPQMGMGQMGMQQMGMPQMGMGQMGMQQMGMPQMGMPQMGMMQMGMPQMGMQQNVNIQPAQFQSFNQDVVSGVSQENIGLIMDVPLEVTVELGRTTKSIADILDFAPGTIIELDRIAGDPIDVLVNGKFVARGEVMVIEESFAIRVTEIIK